MTVDDYLADKKPEAVALFHEFARLADACGESEVVPRTPMRVTESAQLDGSIAAMLREAYETVGPGTRR